MYYAKPLVARSLLLALAIAGCERPSTPATHSTFLPTGRSLDSYPPAATQPVGSFPSNMIASADGKYFIVSDIGFRQSLWSIRSSDGKGVSHIDFPMKKGDANGLYYGLAASSDGTIFAAQG